MNRFAVAMKVLILFCHQIYQTNSAIQRRRHKPIYVLDVFDLRDMIRVRLYRHD